MRGLKQRAEESTFDINLAPFLDIIVSIVPLLLLSMVFVEVKMIEIPIPQVVADAIQRNKNDTDPKVTINLKVSKKNGLRFEVVNRGATKNLNIPNRAGEFDLEGLHSKAFELKKTHPEIFSVGVLPESDVPFRELVKVMDQLRQTKGADTKIAFNDKATGKMVETKLMFPNLSFANIIPGE